MKCEYCGKDVREYNLERHHEGKKCRQAQMKKKAEFRELLRELRQTRFGMRLGGVQEEGATKQEEQKERMDEWEEWDVEETVEPVVYQPNCMRCDEWGVGVDCIGSGDSRRVISRGIICWACGAIAPGLKQRLVGICLRSNQARGKRARARNRRKIAEEHFCGFEDAADSSEYTADSFEDTADSPTDDILDKLPDVVFEEAMATPERSNQNVEFDPVEFRHQTEEWLDEVCQCF